MCIKKSFRFDAKLSLFIIYDGVEMKRFTIEKSIHMIHNI